MGTYKINVNQKQIACKQDETLLNASIRQCGGIFIGCKGGGCGLCKIKVHQGETLDGIWSKSVLSNEEFAQGYRLACQAKPITNLSIETCRQANRIF